MVQFTTGFLVASNLTGSEEIVTNCSSTLLLVVADGVTVG
jgi:hypothetical protein